MVERPNNTIISVLFLRTELDLDAEVPPSKKARVDEDTDFSMASLARGEITQARGYSIGEGEGEGKVEVPQRLQLQLV